MNNTKYFFKNIKLYKEREAVWYKNNCNKDNKKEVCTRKKVADTGKVARKSKFYINSNIIQASLVDLHFPNTYHGKPG